ncbi:hypothetical protein PHMEG_00035435, partial [Phytophthora megakarya]
MVSGHDNSLRRCSIKCMSLTNIQQISDMETCLSDLTARVTRGRCKRFDKEEVKKLKAHDGEFLRVVKENVSLQSKIAMISFVT